MPCGNKDKFRVVFFDFKSKDVILVKREKITKEELGYIMKNLGYLKR